MHVDTLTTDVIKNAVSVKRLPEAMLPLPLHDPGVVLVHKPNGEGEVPEERERSTI
jgi:hypothetical protein